MYIILIILVIIKYSALLNSLVSGRLVSDPALVSAALWVVLGLKAKECHSDRNWNLLVSGIDFSGNRANRYRTNG